MILTLTAQACPHSSFSRLAVELFSRLRERGHEVFFKPVEQRGEPLPFAVRQHFVKVVQGREIVMTPQSIVTLPSAKDSVCFTTWETTRLPEANVVILNRFSQVWVPSDWCRTALLQSGVTVPVKVVPFGVDAVVFFPDRRPNRPALRFGSIVNHPAIIRAFQKAFQDPTTKVELVATEGTMPTHELVEWYQKLDCYVDVHHEQSLSAMEALACGVPVISTRPDSSYTVFGKLTEAGDDMGHHIEPDENELTEAMQRVCWDRDELLDRKKAARVIAEAYTVEGMVDCVEAIFKARPCYQ